AEIALVGGEDDGFHVVGMSEIAEGISQFGIRLEGDWIFAFGAFQPDHRYAAILHTPVEVLRCEGAHAHGRRPPLRMRSASPSKWSMSPSSSSASNSESSSSIHCSCAAATVAKCAAPFGVSRTMNDRRSLAGAWRST